MFSELLSDHGFLRRSRCTTWRRSPSDAMMCGTALRGYQMLVRYRARGGRARVARPTLL